MKAWHGGLIIAVLIGYALGYWWPTLGNATIGKISPQGS